MLQGNASDSGPAMVPTNASGSGASMLQINEIGYTEAHAPAGVWICVILLLLMVISCFAAWLFMGRKPHSQVDAPVFLRGTQQRAARSSKATPGIIHGMHGSSPLLGTSGRPASPSSLLEPEPAALLRTGEPVGAGTEVGSLLSALRPSVAGNHDDNTLGPTSRSSMVSDDTPGLNPYFCQDLIVPPGCECILKVPFRCLSKGPFDARDPNENPVLRIEPRPLHQAGSGGEGLLKLVLTTEFGVIVAQCMPSPARVEGRSPEREQRECVLIRSSGDAFAVIKREEEHNERYTMTTKLDGRLHIWGSKRQQALNVVDPTGKLVAKTCSATDQVDFSHIGAMAGQQPQVFDSEKVYFKVRVAPLMDVGLILCVLLCIHHLM